MRAWPLVCAALLATAAAAAAATAALARRQDQDFEFADTAEMSENALSGERAQAQHGHARRPPRRYVYDPHNGVCAALVCAPREVCLVRDAFTALCADRRDVLRRGDVIVSAAPPAPPAPLEEADDVFYDAAPPDPTPTPTPKHRCVGCGGGGGGGGGGAARPAAAGFLCGADNRTYSSLCRLDLHNCVRAPAPPVRVQCRGFCPCAERPRAPRPRQRAHGRTEWRRRKTEAAHNDVLPDRPYRRRQGGGGGAGCALDKMANRLLDWFSVLMEDADGGGADLAGFPADCKPEVRWMFAHLDANADGALSAADLYALRHDDRERCLRPFLASCGDGGGGGVRRGAWCACFSRAARPCTALARAHAAAARTAGAYAPACDARGFYRPRQCHPALGVCWCVDAHGAERPHTRTKGEPPCPPHDAPLAPPEDDEDAGAGSGDNHLRY